MSKINVAIIGAGNCASSLVQGVYKYRETPEDEFIPGLMNPTLGGYHISDLNFVAAFDIDSNKVGKDLSEAIFTAPNNTAKFADVPLMNVPVERGFSNAKYLIDSFQKNLNSSGDDYFSFQIIESKAF